MAGSMQNFCRKNVSTNTPRTVLEIFHWQLSSTHTISGSGGSGIPSLCTSFSNNSEFLNQLLIRLKLLSLRIFAHRVYLVRTVSIGVLVSQLLGRVVFLVLLRLGVALVTWDGLSFERVVLLSG